MPRVIYVDADEPMKARIAHEWGDLAARHMHLADGFSIVALDAEQPVGLIAVSYRGLPAPLVGTYEGYVDIVEVHSEYRRQGIATQLIAMVVDRLRAQHVYQVRAWSSEDKAAALQLWKALGFTLCPATTYPLEQAVQGYFVAKRL
jgi:GNAT superfamily N-acetyltransferase